MGKLQGQGMGGSGLGREQVQYRKWLWVYADLRSAGPSTPSTPEGREVWRQGGGVYGPRKMDQDGLGRRRQGWWSRAPLHPNPCPVVFQWVYSALQQPH